MWSELLSAYLSMLLVACDLGAGTLSWGEVSACFLLCSGRAQL